MEMVEAVIEKLSQLLMEEIREAEVEKLGSALKQMQSLLEIRKQKQQQLLLHDDYDQEGADLVEEWVYEADDLVDKITYHGLLKSQVQKQYVDLVGSGGMFGRFMRSLHNLLFPIFYPTSAGEEAASLTLRIRLVNTRLLTTAKAIHPPPCPQVKGQRAAGDLDDDDDSDDVWKLFDDVDDIWNKDSTAVAVDDFVVGREDAIEEVICALLGGDEKSKDDLKIISICGMGGIGKTTLARTVYQDCSVRHHFDCLAWATVGKSFRTRNVLEDLLLQLVFPTRDDMAQFSALDLAQNLYEFLQPKRYLIVLDDLWSTDAWDCLRIAFPSRETTGSRVLLTTREALVADKIASSVHHMRTLNQDEAWELLRKKALRDSKAHAELLEIGKDIAKGCQGLPLAITVMAGLLASKPTLHKWKMVHQSFVSYQTIDQGPQDSSKGNPILALSYNFLPQPLKPCFLYLGAVFPEDAEIDAESLYRLWLAEGFIPSTLGSGRLSVMDIAERYLNELVTRSLVLVHKREFSKFRRSKSCRVHDVLRDFCLAKAKEQNFCDAISFRCATETGPCTYSTTRIRRLTLSFEDGCVVPYNWNTDKQLHSISVQSSSHDQQQFSSLRFSSDVKDLSRLRVLFLSGFNYKVSRSPSVTGELDCRRFLSIRYIPQVLSDLTKFKRLRSLSFSGFNFNVPNLPTGIDKLFRLRYLSIRDCNITRLPSTIGSLLNLETLDLGEGTRIRMLIPNVLQKLISLRYLYLPCSYQVIEGDKLQLDWLIKLETLVNFDSRQCRAKDLCKLIKLQKLVATIDDNFEDLEEIINCINTRLNCLRLSSLFVRMDYSRDHFVIHQPFGCVKLDVLQIEGLIGKLPLRISQSLIEISLSGSELDDDPMEKLEKLPNLGVLVLHNNAFLGKHMTCSDMGMPKLKYLSIFNLPNLENLTVKRGGMPKLSSLVLRECQNLKKLPEGLNFLTSLQELIVANMPPAFMDQLNVTGEEFPKFQLSLIRDGVFICHKKYAKEILKKFYMEDCKFTSTPMNQKEKFSLNDGTNKVVEG